jgi:uncharacterized protein YgiM (DUF1202 family)
LRCAAALIVCSLILTLPARVHAAPQHNRACDGVVSVTLTNVRRGPGLEYEVVTQLPQHEKVIAIGLDLTARWYIVYLPQENNAEARWIHYKNLRITKNCVKALRASAVQSDR